MSDPTQNQSLTLPKEIKISASAQSKKPVKNLDYKEYNEADFEKQIGENLREFQEKRTRFSSGSITFNMSAPVSEELTSLEEPEIIDRGVGLNFNLVEEAGKIAGSALNKATEAAKETVLDSVDLVQRIVGLGEYSPSAQESSIATSGMEVSAQPTEEEQKERQAAKNLEFYRRIIDEQKHMVKLREISNEYLIERVLNGNAGALLENPVSTNSEDRVKAETKPQKIGSSKPKSAFDLAEFRTYEIHFEANQQVWAGEVQEKIVSEEELEETRVEVTVDLNAIAEGGTGKGKANISATGGAGAG